MKTLYRVTILAALMLAMTPVIAAADDIKSQQQQEQTTDASAPLIAEIEALKAAAQIVDGKNAENTARFIQAAQALRRRLVSFIGISDVRSEEEFQQVEERLMTIIRPQGKLRSLFSEVRELMERMQTAQYYGNDEIVGEVAFLNCTPMGVKVRWREAEALIDLVEPFYHSYLHTIDLAEKTDGTDPVITKEFCKSARETGDHFTWLLAVLAQDELDDDCACQEEVEAFNKIIQVRMVPLVHSVEKKVKRVRNILRKMKEYDYYGDDDIKQAVGIIVTVTPLEEQPEPEEATPDQIQELETRFAERAAAVRANQELNVQGGPGFTKETAWVMKDTTPDAAYDWERDILAQKRVIRALGLPDSHSVHNEIGDKAYDVHTIDEGRIKFRLYFDITAYWKKRCEHGLREHARFIEEVEIMGKERSK